MLPILSPLRFPLDIPTEPIGDVDFTAAAEALVRGALANCAPQLLVPSIPQGMAKVGAALRLAELAPTARSRIKILDRRDTIWKAIRLYMLPVHRKFKDSGWNSYPVQRLAEDLYYLTLATRWNAQVHLDVERHIRFIDEYCLRNRRIQLEPEVAARLALIRGTLDRLRPHDKLPGLGIRADAACAFRERISEILEDAYLTEASEMRRFLSYEANKASIRKSLRRLLHTISTTSRWAKGMVKLVEHTAGLPTGAADILGALLENVQVQHSSIGPVVLRPNEDPGWRSLFSREDGSGGWKSPVKPLEQEIEGNVVLWQWYGELWPPGDVSRDP